MLVVGICIFSIFGILKKGKKEKEKAHERRKAVLTIKPNPLFKNQTEHKKNKTTQGYLQSQKKKAAEYACECVKYGALVKVAGGNGRFGLVLGYCHKITRRLRFFVQKIMPLQRK